MNTNDYFLGIVQLGRFKILTPEDAVGSSVRLTGIDVPAPVPPESEEIERAEHEGVALMVSGHHSGNWIYSAQVIEEAGPILTAVVQHVFGQASQMRTSAAASD